jgi:hypothetical protein
MHRTCNRSMGTIVSPGREGLGGGRAQEEGGGKRKKRDREKGGARALINCMLCTEYEYVVCVWL